ncbi:MAG TPA: nucleoside-diphosphate sugar epimerase/dehydratase [Actinomycetota bacterium]|nr:nucleoside-diphosphate sugar epimerase/dehydratase [Actinomycetota bacterium]
MIELFDRRPPRRREGNGLHCLVIGAGEAGRSLARDLLRTPEFGLVPVGFLDDSPAKVRRRIAGLQVFGTTRDLSAVAERHQVEVVIVAIPSLRPREIRRLAVDAAAAGLAVRYLPSFGAALERDARISDLRRLRVDRLLGRDEVQVVRRGSRATVAGKRVLVTGAGGSIGSELCRQIAAFDPEALYLLDHDESNLHRLQLQIQGEALLDSDELLIADIRDQGRIGQIFRDLRPQVVFHAAAHKHLPLLERHPCEGVKSNVLGTLNLVRAAVAHEAERFILISTDKAADPTSVLGVTKRVAEMIVQAHQGGGATRMASVRFGNVLGSRGSLLSVLSEQIESGEDVTVTHPDVTRFFMTVEEAVGLVVEAAGMARAGEVFVLEMGEPVRIVDLVHNYAAQIHVDPGDLTIRYTGLRPGEKLNETLFSEGEQRVATGHPKVWATAASKTLDNDFFTLLASLEEGAQANDMDECRSLLAKLVPEYNAAPESAGPASTAPYPDGF